MFQQATAHLSLWLVALFVVFIIGIIGCGSDDDNAWVGTWAIETIDGKSVEQVYGEVLTVPVSIVTYNWTFNSDGTVEAEFTFEIDGLETSKVIMGTYSLTGSDFTLSLIAAVKVEVPEGTIDGLEETYEDIGTWSRKGNTLTINSKGSLLAISSNDDFTIVFRKK